MVVLRLKNRNGSFRIGIGVEELKRILHIFMKNNPHSIVASWKLNRKLFDLNSTFVPSIANDKYKNEKAY